MNFSCFLNDHVRLNYHPIRVQGNAKLFSVTVEKCPTSPLLKPGLACVTEWDETRRSAGVIRRVEEKHRRVKLSCSTENKEEVPR